MASASHLRCWIMRLLPLLAAVAFVGMVAIGEKEVRSSSNWPPPARHEVGGWTVDEPAVLQWAAAINLPATVPILWLWSHNDALAYAFEDHQLITYLPWLVLVIALWSFIAFRIENASINPPPESRRERYLVLCAQAFITLELVYVGTSALKASAAAPSHAADRLVWVWVLAVIVGWIEFFHRSTRHGAT